MNQVIRYKGTVIGMLEKADRYKGKQFWNWSCKWKDYGGLEPSKAEAKAELIKEYKNDNHASTKKEPAREKGGAKK